MEDATKVCTKCLIDKPVEQFGRQAKTPDGRRYLCNDCQKAYMAEWRARNRDYLRDAASRRWQNMPSDEKTRKREMDLARYHAAPEVARDKILRRKYGISLAEYDTMLLAQGGCCAICGNENEGKVLAVDHHHGTGAVRGLLCDSCNNGLGRFRDNPEFLANAIAYLLNT